MRPVKPMIALALAIALLAGVALVTNKLITNDPPDQIKQSRSIASSRSAKVEQFFDALSELHRTEVVAEMQNTREGANENFESMRAAQKKLKKLRPKITFTSKEFDRLYDIVKTQEAWSQRPQGRTSAVTRRAISARMSELIIERDAIIAVNADFDRARVIRDEKLNKIKTRPKGAFSMVALLAFLGFANLSAPNDLLADEAFMGDPKALEIEALNEEFLTLLIEGDIPELLDEASSEVAASPTTAP